MEYYNTMKRYKKTIVSYTMPEPVIKAVQRAASERNMSASEYISRLAYAQLKGKIKHNKKRIAYPELFTDFDQAAES